MGEIAGLLTYYADKISENPIIKSVIAGLIVVLENMFGVFGQPLQILIMLMLIDLITGIAGAIVTEQGLKRKFQEYRTTTDIVSSRTMRNGIWKFIEYMLAIFIANVISIQFGIDTVREFVILWLTVTELKSVHENFYEMGFEIPLAKHLLSWAEKQVDKKDKFTGGD